MVRLHFRALHKKRAVFQVIAGRFQQIIHARLGNKGSPAGQHVHNSRRMPDFDQRITNRRRQRLALGNRFGVQRRSLAQNIRQVRVIKGFVLLKQILADLDPAQAQIPQNATRCFMRRDQAACTERPLAIIRIKEHFEEHIPRHGAVLRRNTGRWQRHDVNQTPQQRHPRATRRVVRNLVRQIKSWFTGHIVSPHARQTTKQEVKAY